MTSQSRDLPRIPSRGWRTIWISRIIIAALTLFGIVVDYSFFGLPWQDSFAIYPLLLTFGFLFLLLLFLESMELRWISVSPDRVVFGYLFSNSAVSWDCLRRGGPIPDELNVVRTMVTYEQLPPSKFWGRRYHSVTMEQSEFINHKASWAGTAKHKQ